MDMAYTKLHQSLVTSTIWREPHTTRIVWITMMALADQHGEVMASIPGLADSARVSIKECEDALAAFLAPDPYSRTKDFEGRRIENIDGGWSLLNHPKYRKMASKEDSKEKASARTARYRARVKAGLVDACLSTPCDGMSTQGRDIAEAEAEAEEKEVKTKSVAAAQARFAKPTFEEVEEYGKTLAPKFTRVSEFLDFYDSKGWKIGTSPMKDWKAAVRTWNRKDDGGGQPQLKATGRGW